MSRKMGQTNTTKRADSHESLSSSALPEEAEGEGLMEGDEEGVSARSRDLWQSSMTSDRSSSSDWTTTADAVHVAVRTRPLNEVELRRQDRDITQFPGDGTIWIEQPQGIKAFTYNVAFSPTATQSDLFENSGIKRLIEMAVDGYSCTAFAFGQTGSGKTYTMTGPPEHDTLSYMNTDLRGLIPRSFYYLIDLIQKQHLNNTTSRTGYRITASYLEIYNEQVNDLLNPNYRSHLAVRWSTHKGFYVENLFAAECETIRDLQAVLDEGLRNRATGANTVNEHSSRSHSMLTIHIDSDMQGGGVEGEGVGVQGEEEKVFVVKHGKLTFVDLAGSEKTRTDVMTGRGHVIESNNINKSLLVLGNCISALGDAKKRRGHIPYRDSKLTKLLADSLQGKGVTLMIACISSSIHNSSETMNTLRYANRARHIKSKPVVIMDPRETLIVSLKKEIKILRQENHYLRQQLDFPVKPRGQLQKENDTKFLQMLQNLKRDGRLSVNGGPYEMLQEYMLENEQLRNENREFYNSREMGRREHQELERENERLLRQLELRSPGSRQRSGMLLRPVQVVEAYPEEQEQLVRTSAGLRALVPAESYVTPAQLVTTNTTVRPMPYTVATYRKPPHHLSQPVYRSRRSLDSLVGDGREIWEESDEPIIDERFVVDQPTRSERVARPVVYRRVSSHDTAAGGHVMTSYRR